MMNRDDIRRLKPRNVYLADYDCFVSEYNEQGCTGPKKDKLI